MPTLEPDLSESGLHQAEDGSDLSEAELRRYVLRNLMLTGVVLASLLAVLAGLGAWYANELQAWAVSVFDVLGLVGLSAIVFAADSITSPIPPDVALVVLANSALRTAWWPPLVIGIVSTCAGCVGWWVGGHLGRLRLVRLLFDRSLKPSHRALITRYGRLGVVIGALTPVPFSITCWLAGMASMRLNHFLPACAVRIPRIILYYVLIAESTRLAGP